MSENETRNRRPNEASKLPYISLMVLIAMIAGLLYVGYEYIADDAAGVDQLLNTPVDPNDRELQPVPKTTETTSTPSNEIAENVDVAADDKTTAGSTPKDEEEVATPTPHPEEEGDQKTEEKPKPVAVDPGGIEITHVVQEGETFYGIANRYNVRITTLKGLNPSIQDESKDIKSGVTKIKIRVQAIHTVGPGDILRVVAAKYGIPVEQLMAANKKTQNLAERGEKLIIPFPEKK